MNKFASKYDTLDRGTYYISKNKKTIHFFIEGRESMYIWEDDYILNGYMMNGYILKVNTLNARIYLFLERNHPIIE